MKASFKIINPKIIEQKLNQIKTLKKKLIENDGRFLY